MEEKHSGKNGWEERKGRMDGCKNGWEERNGRMDGRRGVEGTYVWRAAALHPLAWVVSFGWRLK